ncbi:MAG: CoA transferase [Gammaproteobacteria bacterium]|nr:CoA transferase [Gammaproteobacteria bacterium]
MVKLLEGVSVLDFTHVHAGPLCTYQLALMGASVLKVESPDGGDQMRQMGRSQPPGMSPGFMGQNANKRSLAIDLKTDNGQSVIKQLIAKADVVVVNMRPGTMKRLGIDYDACRELKPTIVYCAISGYGQEGPESARPAMDHLMQGESGMFLATGTSEQPVRVGFAIVDSSTAVIASSAINAALLRAQRTGEGTFLDVSMLECAMTVMGLNYYNYLATGVVNPRPGPNPLASIGSAGTWPCSEGTLLVNANSYRGFTRMSQAVGRADLIDDPRFDSIQKLSINSAELRSIFGEIFKTGSAAHWDRVLTDAGVPSGTLKAPPDTVEHSQLAFRKSIGSIDNVPGRTEALRFLGAGFLVDGSPTTPEESPPLLGQHSRTVLQELGYSSEAIDSFIQAKVVSCPDDV